MRVYRSICTFVNEETEMSEVDHGRTDEMERTGRHEGEAAIDVQAARSAYFGLHCCFVGIELRLLLVDNWPFHPEHR